MGEPAYRRFGGDTPGSVGVPLDACSDTAATLRLGGRDVHLDERELRRVMRNLRRARDYRAGLLARVGKEATNGS